MKKTELRDYQLDFEKVRPDLKSNFKEINSLREKFVADYPISEIPELTKDENSEVSNWTKRIWNR